MAREAESASIALRPMDIIVLCKLLVSKENYRNLKQLELAYTLKVSQPTISNAVSRLIASRLLTSSGEVNPDAAAEFILHGLKYILPVEPGPVTGGMLTAHSAPGIAQNFRFDQSESYVWPDAQGRVKGHSIAPIHKSAIPGAKSDDKLYELLALIDILRVGRSREIKYAREQISKIIGVKIR